MRRKVKLYTKVLLLPVLLLSIFLLSANNNGNNSKKEPVLEYVGFEPDTLIIGLETEINSVEDIEALLVILEKYVDSKDIEKISRIIEPEKLKDKKKIKNKEYKLFRKVKKRLFSSYKIKFKKNKVHIFSLEKKLKKEKDVEYAQKNFHYQLDFEPDDPHYQSGSQWGIQSTNTNTGWDTVLGDDVVVAVVDTGLDYNHPDIINNLWTDDEGNFGYDYSDDDNDPADSEVHGTHVAGIIAAVTNNGIGTAGVAPNVKIMTVKVFPNATSSVLANGLRYAADMSADVINCSWGPKYRRADDPVVNDAIDYAYAAGCVIVFSAGNSNDDAQYYFGANHPNTICVASVDENLNRPPTSNFGTVVDVAAPGVDIYSLAPGGQYASMSGTSMAAPFVAGLVALLRANNEDLSNDQIRRLIVENALALTEPLFYGAGLMDTTASLLNSPGQHQPPVIINVPPVDEGEHIFIYGNDFEPDNSMVVINGNGLNAYAQILDITADRIELANSYESGTYSIQVLTDTAASDWSELIINPAAILTPPELGLIPHVEEEQEIIIYGRNIDTANGIVQITGEAVDEEAEISFICGTAVKIENYYDPGDYEITIFNGDNQSNVIPFTIYPLGTLPAPTYSTYTGWNPFFNWINGDYYDNIINGNTGTDYINGWQGNDLLNGNTGGDVYIYGIGHGVDLIEDTGGQDRITLMNIDSEEITPATEGDDYIIYVPHGRVTIKNQFGGNAVETLAIWY